MGKRAAAPQANPTSPARSDDEDGNAPEEISFAAGAAGAVAAQPASRKRRRAAAAVRPVLRIAPISADVLAALEIPPVASGGAEGGRAVPDAAADSDDDAEEERARRRRARARSRARAADADAALQSRPAPPLIRDGIHVVVAPTRGARFDERAHDGAAAAAAESALTAAAAFVKSQLFGGRLRRVGGSTGAGAGTARGGGAAQARRRAAPRGLHIAAFARK